MLICWSLNFHYCTGWEKATHLEHSRELSPSQRAMVVGHIKPAVERMLVGDPSLPSKAEVREQLQKKGYGYDGSTWVVMEQIEAEKVIACWPSKEATAVQPITKFVSGQTKALLESPGSTILEPHEWPDRVPQSYVRATDEEWEKVVKAGYALGLFQHCPDREVLRSPSGERILNGAGAVPKMKKGKRQQRFISILCPLNAVSRKIEGDEGTLPYVGQVGLCLVPQDGVIVIDSEDLQSAFNLFEMPRGWRGMFVYRTPVHGSVLGLDNDDLAWVALRTVPMGWLSAVGVVQQAIRTLAFDMADLPRDREIQKHQELAEGERYLLYLDSVDQLRPLRKELAEISQGVPSAEHLRFKKKCEELGFPTNEGKMIVGALFGTL